MGLLSLSDECGNLVTVIEEVTQAMKDLGFGEIQSVRDFEDGFALKIQRRDMPNRDAQAVDDRLAASNLGNVLFAMLCLNPEWACSS